jgi:hypothetical protein
MILKRLYELAEREKLLDDPAFESQPVPIIIKVGESGKYLGIEERRGEIVITTKKGAPKTRPDRGKEILVPKPHGNTANSGFARFFADTFARVLPVDSMLSEKDRKKSNASRDTFWRQIAEAARAANDPALIAISAFGRELMADP